MLPCAHSAALRGSPAVARGRAGCSSVGLQLVGEAARGRRASHAQQRSARATLTEPVINVVNAPPRPPSPPVPGRPAPREARIPRKHRLQARESADKRVFTLDGLDASCNVWSDGEINIFRNTPMGPTLAARAKAAIPWFVARGQCVCDDAVPGQLTLRWGQDAVLRLTTTDVPTEAAWAKARAEHFPAHTS